MLWYIHAVDKERGCVCVDVWVHAHACDRGGDGSETANLTVETTRAGLAQARRSYLLLAM